MTSVSPSDVRPDPGATHPLDKRELRHAARARRAAIAAGLTPGQRDSAARAIAEAVLALVADLGRRHPDRAEPGVRVAVYESLPDEPPTGRLIEALHAGGHEVLVPVTLWDWSLRWRHAEPGAVGDASTVARRAAPSRPAADAVGPGASETGESGWLGQDALEGVDLVITPGLSVDRLGTRLGQGGGCYDRALGHRQSSTPVLTLLHEGELSETTLPRDEHDEPVDGVVTTAGRVVRVSWPVPTRPAPG